MFIGRIFFCQLPFLYTLRIFIKGLESELAVNIRNADIYLKSSAAVLRCFCWPSLCDGF